MSLPLTRVLTRGRCSRGLGGSAHLPPRPSVAAAAVPVAAAGGAAAARHPPLPGRRRPASSTTAPAAASPRVAAASTTPQTNQKQQQQQQQQQQAAVRPPPSATSLAARLAPPPPPAVVVAPPPPPPPATLDQPSSSSLGSLGFPDFRLFDAEYALGEVIGAGASGRVHHATHRASGRRVAVKILPKRREAGAGGGNNSSGGSSSPSSSRGGDDVVAEASTSSPSSSSSSSPDPCCRAAAIRREVSATAAASAGSPFAARLEAVYESEGDALLVLERCEGGDLRGLLQDRNGAPLDEASAAAVLRGVLHALAACHAQGMVYGDVKPGNVCLLRPRSAEDSSSSSSSSAADADAPINDTDLSFFGGVRLVDWGAASPAPLAPGALSGSPLYWAPEQAVGFAAAGAMLAGGGDGSGSGDEDGVIGGAPPQSAARGGYGPAVDVWAAGVLAYQLMSGRLPYWGAAASEGGGPPRGLRPWQLLAAIRTAPISAWPGASALARDLVVRCMLERDPARRITAAEALAHPFFAKHGLAGLEAKAAEPRAAPKRRQQKQQQQQKHQSAR